MKLSISSWDLVPQILPKFAPNCPDSKTSYNILKSASELIKQHPTFECYLLTPDGEVDCYATFVLMIPTHRYELHFHTLSQDVEEFAAALVSCAHIDWTRSPTISSLPARLYPILDSLEIKLPQHIRVNCPVRSFHINREAALLLTPRVPDGVRLDRLNEDNAAFINSQWPHGQTEQSLQEVVDYIKYSEAIGLFEQDTGEIVAWCVQGNYGGPGLLHVLEEHRRKGYGEVLLATITRNSAELGFDPHAFITPYNTASMQLFMKLGYVEMYQAAWISFMYKEDQSSTLN